jgi:hypothetical protein
LLKKKKERKEKKKKSPLNLKKFTFSGDPDTRIEPDGLHASAYTEDLGDVSAIVTKSRNKKN